MALFGHKRQAPRLAPGLDDVALDRVLRGIAAARGPGLGAGPQDLAISRLERLLRERGDDWDRRCHRVGVLAQTAPAPARSWRARRPQDPDALALAVWSELTTDPQGALALCRVAAAARPADPTPWVGALAALRLLGRPSSELPPSGRRYARVIHGTGRRRGRRCIERSEALLNPLQEGR